MVVVVVAVELVGTAVASAAAGCEEPMSFEPPELLPELPHPATRQVIKREKIILGRHFFIWSDPIASHYRYLITKKQ
jgi:hypothetical protein